MKAREKKISVVLPVYNEEGVLEELHEGLIEVAKHRSEKFEFLFINDGSIDGSLEKLLECKKQDDRICVIDLARNFGHQNSLAAGLFESEGDAVILMDADLEDSPQDILKFLSKWDEGYQVVYGIRENRRTSFLKSLFFKLFHKVNRKLSVIDIEEGGIFGLMDRVVVDEIKKIKEYNLYLPGLRNWVGFKQLGIKVSRGARYDNSPRVTIIQLYKLAFNSFTSFSKNLLSLPLFIGLTLFFTSLIALFIIISLKIFYNVGPWGWASLVSVILLISGLQFAFIGLIGEYIFRIMSEVKGRPLYIIKEKYK